MTVIQKIAVIGSGTMGGGIAISALSGGLKTVLVDTSDASLEQAQARVHKYFDRQVSKERMSAQDRENALSCLQVSTVLSAASDADLVVEAVFEDLDIKKSVFSQLEQVVSRTCHLATNTSALRVSEIASALEYPDRFCGLHYFSPAEVNPVVEVVRSDMTQGSTVTATLSFLGTCRKIPIECKDQSGFALNRFFCPYTNEAARCIDDGLGTPAQIDDVAKQVLGVPVGPFFVMNIVKPRINLAAIRNLAHLGPFYEPARSMSAIGDADASWEISDAPATLGASARQVITDRLLGAIFFAVKQELAEEVATAGAIDLGACRAFGFAKGPVEMMRDLGADAVNTLISSVTANVSVSH
ncbi:3-hydroxyacyl-CoA dehydrogenase NAD-binding domain-containing protein [Pelagovum sp. HNIBRBA483]|uniref:3-hydroxyacyl-CoA dehydrogenase n=1 Tax=Pelagovum sp. HNIBRBA483 TaxID=3233341 RepID=UPI0034A3A641